MRIQAVFFLLGRLLLLVSGFLIIPALVSAYYNETDSIYHFLLTAVITLLSAVLLIFSCRRAKETGIGVRDGFLFVTLAWFVISFLGAIPFFLSHQFASFADAFFESVSGFTTTGASVLSNVETLSHGILFWRNFSQWIGGMGIIVLAIAILPQLSVGGMQLIRNEMPGPTFEQLKPRIRQTAMSLWTIYLLFSVTEVVLLTLFGMPLFESFCHMFGTMATGGFSVKNASIGAYASPAIQMTITAFMFLAGTNFVLHYAFLRADFKKIIFDSEWRFYAGLMTACIVAIICDLALQTNIAFWDSLRLATFQVVSITTTTGYSTDDFDLWPHFARGLLFLLMFVGGCAGSTGGGLKQLRLLLLFKRARQSIIQHIYPKAVISIKHNQRVVPEHILHGITSFFLIYIVISSFCTLALLAFNIDFVTATSAVVACLSNIGPGFAQVGAAQNYAFLPDVIKYLLCACMVIGRLEIFTVLVLFFPATWKR